jgi:transcription antitermination factor NusG
MGPFLDASSFRFPAFPLRRISFGGHQMLYESCRKEVASGDKENSPVGLTMRELCPWYAVSVKHQHEQAVQSALVFKGFEALAPTYRARRTWSDRVKELDLPLFAGYVFCRFPFPERAKIIDTPGVAAVVAFGGQPAEIGGSEIAAIQAVMASKLPVRPWPHLKPGDRVCIQRGPLRGMEGTLLRERPEANSSLHLVIGIELLQRSISVALEPDMIVPVRTIRAAVPTTTTVAV